eukprot:10800544-Prorocentrum_lima.AAC.1
MTLCTLSWKARSASTVSPIIRHGTFHRYKAANIGPTAASAIHRNMHAPEGRGNGIPRVAGPHSSRKCSRT